VKRRTLWMCDFCACEEEARKSEYFVFLEYRLLPEGWLLISDGKEEKLVCAAHKVIIE
jgi:hypothetical protein